MAGTAVPAVWRRALVVLFAALCFAPAAPVAAHAFLESSDPPANAVLPTAPPEVNLRFNEPLEPSYSRAELFDQSGALVPGATSSVGSDARTMRVAIPSGLHNGTYS